MNGAIVTPSRLTRMARQLPLSFLRLAGIVMILGVAACGTIAGNLPPAPVMPAVISQQPDLPPYQIQVGDVLGIKLLQANELSEDVTVRPDGHISTTVVEDQPAAGLTVPQLVGQLKDAYGKIMKPPYMTVVVRSFAPSRIYVGGEVGAPGEFISNPPNLTLSQAIARAGGVKLSASQSNVMVIRRGPQDTPQIFLTRYDRIVHGADPTADIRLANFDVVYVPRTSVAEVFSYWNQYVQQFVPVSWGFTYGGVFPTH